MSTFGRLVMFLRLLNYITTPEVIEEQDLRDIEDGRCQNISSCTYIFLTKCWS